MDQYKVGKTYRTASEAFRDADYATAIECPTESNSEAIAGLIIVLAYIVFMAVCIWSIFGN